MAFTKVNWGALFSKPGNMTDFNNLPLNMQTTSNFAQANAGNMPVQTNLGKVVSGVGSFLGGVGDYFSNPVNTKILGQVGAALSKPGSTNERLGMTGAALSEQSAFGKVASKLLEGKELSEIPEVSALSPTQAAAVLDMREKVASRKFAETTTMIKLVNDVKKLELDENYTNALIADIFAKHGFEQKKIDLGNAEIASREKMNTENALTDIKVAEINAAGREKDLAARLQMQGITNAVGLAKEYTRIDENLRREARVQATNLINAKYPGTIVIDPITQNVSFSFKSAQQAQEYNETYDSTYKSYVKQRIENGELPKDYMDFLFEGSFKQAPANSGADYIWEP